MEEVFNIESYKQYLTSFYVYPVDETNEEKRKKAIERYDISFLEKIIEHTQIFGFYTLKKLKEEHSIFDDHIFTSVYIEKEDFLSNGCTGGFHADTLFSPTDFPKDFFVSRYLLQRFLEEFVLYDDEEEIEYYNEKEDVGGVLTYPKITISGSIEKFDTLYRQYINEENIVKLKRFIKM